jgi:hypothetical protein
VHALVLRERLALERGVERGNSRSVSIVARATSGSAVTPSFLRAASTRVMSASITVVHVAAVCSDSSMCRPIDWRMRDSGPLCTGPRSPTCAGAASVAPKRGSRFFGGAGASGRYGLSMCIGGSSAAAAPSPARNASTSCLRTRPPRPVPLTRSRSMSCSAAMRITTGE